MTEEPSLTEEPGLPEVDILSVMSEDGVASRISLYKSGKPDSPVILIMPAMGVKASFYEPLARHLKKQGFHVACADLRGVGTSSVRASRHCNFGYADMINRDWPVIIDTVRLHCSGAAVWLLGHSLGGQLNTLFAATHPEKVAGLILVSSCTVYYRQYPQPLKIWSASQFLRVIAELWGYLPGKKVGFGGNEARRVIRDWARNARSGQYRLENSPLDYDKLLSRLHLPVLGISIESDHFAPRQAVDHLCQKMPHCELTRWHFEDSELAEVKLNHFNWVEHSENLAGRIAAWVRDNDTTTQWQNQTIREPVSGT